MTLILAIDAASSVLRSLFHCKRYVSLLPLWKASRVKVRGVACEMPALLISKAKASVESLLLHAGFALGKEHPDTILICTTNAHAPVVAHSIHNTKGDPALYPDMLVTSTLLETDLHSDVLYTALKQLAPLVGWHHLACIALPQRPLSSAEAKDLIEYIQSLNTLSSNSYKEAASYFAKQLSTLSLSESQCFILENKFYRYYNKHWAIPLIPSITGSYAAYSKDKVFSLLAKILDNGDVL